MTPTRSQPAKPTEWLREQVEEPWNLDALLHGPAAANEVLLGFLKSLQDGQTAVPISQQLAALANLNAIFAKHFRRRDLR